MLWCLALDRDPSRAEQNGLKMYYLLKLKADSQYIQCIRKVFRPLDFFHILIGYSRLLKLIQL